MKLTVRSWQAEAHPASARSPSPQALRHEAAQSPQQDSRAVFWRIHDAGQYLLRVSDPEGYPESLSRECNSRAHRTQSDPVGAFGQTRADQRETRQLLQRLLVRAHWMGPALRAVDSFNSLVETYTHESNNNLVIGGRNLVGDTKRPPTPPPTCQHSRGKRSVVPLSRSAGGRGGGRVRFAGEAARLARLRADIPPSGGGFSCVRAGSAMRRNQRHCRPGRNLHDPGPEYSTTTVAEARALLARPGPRLRFDRLCFRCWPEPRKRCQG